MTIKNVIQFFESHAPLHYAEDFDNVGLLVGDRNWEVTGILVSHDTLESVVDEAVATGCNLIVSFHPIIFSGLKKLTGNNYVERTVLKAIRNDVAIFAIHTAFDNHWEGVHAIMCDRLGLENRRVLLPKKGVIKKLLTFVPTAQTASLQEALFAVGAGSIGNYENCSFTTTGTGSFKAGAAANPVVGKKGETHYEPETQLGVTFPAHAENAVLQALFENHPYEEVAYELTTLENLHQKIGLGMVGELPRPMTERDFLKHLKKCLPTGCIRHSALREKPVKRVAVLGGSGSFAIPCAIQTGADAFVTADLKYHDFYQAENQLLLTDIGHYESEQYTKNSLLTFLTEKITNFAPALERPKVLMSQTNTNPIQYF